MGMAAVIKALLALLWLMNHSAQGFVAPTTKTSCSSFASSTAGMIVLRPPPQQQRSPVSLQSTFLTLADIDTMTLNWIGLAVGTMASLLVYQNDQIQEEKVGTSSSSTTTGSSSSVTMASSSSTTTTTLAPPPPPVAATPRPVSVAAKPAAVAAIAEAPTPPVVVPTKVMKETQKEIKQKLQQVGDTLQSTAATSKSTSTQSEAPIFTEPYSDKVKLSVKRKSRFVGKLTKKVTSSSSVPTTRHHNHSPIICVSVFRDHESSSRFLCHGRHGAIYEEKLARTHCAVMTKAEETMDTTT